MTGHVRRCLGLHPETVPDHGAARTAKWHRKQVRVRQGVTYDQRRARALAAAEIRAAALVKNHPPDLINVALERLVEASLELPAITPSWPGHPLAGRSTMTPTRAGTGTGSGSGG